MGNLASCSSVGTSTKDKEKTIQLVCSDGTVQIFHKPLYASQIIEEYPQCLVCHSDSLYIGQKTANLSPYDELKLGNKYFLLPQHLFHSPLSLLSLASLIWTPPPTKASPTSTAHRSASLRSIERASVFCQPFEIQKSDVGGGLRIRVCPEFISKLMEDRRLNADEGGHSVGAISAVYEPGRLCNTPELQKEYTKLIKCRGQRWRPKLDTIKEKEKKIKANKFMLRILR